jgi:hypothetical protein
LPSLHVHSLEEKDEDEESWEWNSDPDNVSSRVSSLPDGEVNANPDENNAKVNFGVEGSWGIVSPELAVLVQGHGDFLEEVSRNKVVSIKENI